MNLFPAKTNSQPDNSIVGLHPTDNQNTSGGADNRRYPLKSQFASMDAPRAVFLDTLVYLTQYSVLALFKQTFNYMTM